MLSQCTPSWTSTSANWLVSISVLELSPVRFRLHTKPNARNGSWTMVIP
ncbi:Uncharacterised protein [Mycobacteroides abscessus subsp. abscessus]|nr:Uncharacterised protein [Mycobacteroides abscessus subsp. abscessus]